MSKSRIIIAVLLLTVALLGVVLAEVILSTHNINNTVSINTVGAMIVATHYSILLAGSPINTSLLVPVTSISWGGFNPGDCKSSMDIMNDSIGVVDTGNVGIKIKWTASGVPSGFSLVCIDNGSGQPIASDYYWCGLTPGTANGNFYFTLTSINPLAVPGSWNFTISIIAAQN
jgi:hypothetical protein